MSTVTSFEVKTSVAAGAWLAAGGAQKTVEVSGTFVGTLKLEGRIGSSGAAVQVGSDITAPGLYNVVDASGRELNVTELRIDTTAYTSGTPVAQLKQAGR